jgi:hypothetical protein
VCARDKMREEEARRVRHIHALIADAIEMTDPEELEYVMAELRAALKDHIHRIKAMAVIKLSPGLRALD